MSLHFTNLNQTSHDCVRNHKSWRHVSCVSLKTNVSADHLHIMPMWTRKRSSVAIEQATFTWLTKCASHQILLWPRYWTSESRLLHMWPLCTSTSCTLRLSVACGAINWLLLTCCHSLVRVTDMWPPRLCMTLYTKQSYNVWGGSQLAGKVWKCNKYYATSGMHAYVARVICSNQSFCA